jgi:hypothetical protein
MAKVFWLIQEVPLRSKAEERSKTQLLTKTERPRKHFSVEMPKVVLYSW